MKIEDKIIDEKLQYDINREVAKISAFSSGKIHKYEYLAHHKIYYKIFLNQMSYIYYKFIWFETHNTEFINSDKW